MESQILEVIKETEKSRIFLAYSNDHHCMVVKKHLCVEPEIYCRLKNLTHPYLPKIYDVTAISGETVVTEDYIPGRSIAEVSANEKQLLKWFFELCDVLSFLHKHGVLHRDIKPSNLLIGADGHIRLIDFDAARVTKEDAESDTRLLGTRGYAPPEQYGFAQTDERADIYALGVTFRELLGNTANKFRWKRILNKCTTLEPKRRYRSVKQMKFSVVFGRLLRRVILPVLLSLFFLFSGFMLWSYTTDTGVHEAMNIVLSSPRDLIFNAVDMDAVKRSSLTMRKFSGDEREIYKRVSTAAPERMYISTGYSIEGGYLLLGGFSTTYHIGTGDLIYNSFDGLFYMDIDRNIHHISPKDCVKYAPAVLKLYELNIFD